jgi:2-polyprenyl-6-methoxyphenol hydroxylase-like FAD-dependent oxidoreductase
MTVPDDQPILVVGAGPVGLLAAAELVRRDIPVRIIDRLPAPTTQSRAIVVHARSLEMLDHLGVVGAVIGAGVTTTAMEMRAAGRRLARFDLDRVDSPFAYSVTIAQTETERILTEFLAHRGATVERGVELTGLDQDETGVRATVTHPGGVTEAVAAPYLAGADGARSDVRRLVGAALAGSFQGERFLMGDVEADHDLDPHTMYTYFARHAGPLLAFPMRGRRMRIIAQLDHEAASREASMAWLQEVTDERAGAISITSAHWLTVFEIHHAQVPAYRFGRVFLAGDAAHVHSPAGGQGMNTGLQDAFNLGWKLALAASGPVPDALLDSYHAERHPVAAKVIEFTTRLTELGTVESGLARTLRNTVLHAASGLAPVRLAMANQTEEVALAYRGSPLVIDGRPHRRAGARLHAGDHMPDVPGTDLRPHLTAETGHVLVTVAPPGAAAAPAPGLRQVLVTDRPAEAPGYATVIADPERRTAARLGLPAGGRVMVRPDGYAGSVSNLDDHETMAAYARRLGQDGSWLAGR